jgi:hypothetical protein
VRRHRSGLEWALRVVLAVLLVVLGVLLGGLIRGDFGPWKETTSSTSVTTSSVPAGVVTVPPPSDVQDAATVRSGCGASSLMNDRVAEAQELDNPSLLDNVATGPGTPWYKVTGMEIVGNDPKYSPLANDVRGFIQAFSVAQANGDLKTLELSMAYVISSCQTLGDNTDVTP